MNDDLKNPDPIPAPRKRRGIFTPIFFFGLGILCFYLYTHYYKAEPKESGTATPPGPAVELATEKKPAGPKILYYVDPMNPSNKSDKPGKAPCGMDMEPVYDETPNPESLPPGTVKLSPEKQQLIGVKFGEVAEIPLSKTIRAVGRATYDETRIHHIHTRFAGWVDNIYVDFVGKFVKKGQPLFSIYSPELVATQQELLVAKKSAEILKKSEFAGLGSETLSLYDSAVEKLKLFQISDQEIKQIERHGKPIRSLTLNSHIDGFVIARNVFAGHQVGPELELYTIADISNIWIIAEVYEYEMSALRLGQTAVVSFPSFPGKVFTGRVTYIQPDLDPKTRTAKVRIELPNKNFLIKPDMYADVELKADFGRSLSVPQEAVLDSGASQTVFVSKEGGYFEPRKVTLGPKVDNRFVVLSGVKEGEQVVTSANFLIDSESQLKSATGGMEAAGHAGHGGGEAPAAEKPGEADHSANTGAAPAAVDHSGHTGSTPAAVDHSGHTGN